MPRLTPLSLQGPAGALQAELLEPEATPAFVATVAHPHPLYGGDMDNHVVTTAANAVVERGGAALRFNFRGTGGSEGRHDEGRGETEDLGACEQELRRRFPRSPRIGVGYSFGAVVTMARLPQAQVEADPPAGLLLIAPPLTHYDFEAATTATVPVAVVYGQLDAFTTDAMIRRLPRRWPTLGSCLEVAGAGHDLSSPELGPTIRQALKSLLP
ncbi:MAG: alpha/beta hydrolase [Holophagales bacterium]|nr:alpha/beta hydrolase [Holophagales bacterium]MYH25342.1 alpha/beta hydrolase [Holophagales bacterium]